MGSVVSNTITESRSTLAWFAQSSTRVLGAFLLAAIVFRAATLEINDLIDPTEARYASIAQEMVLGDDWVTPRLPMPSGLEPYMGKPPLHFWLTAASYSMFGIDEWTSRLPSFVGTLLIVALLLVFSRRFLSLQIGLAGAGILLSSAIFFFFSGASVVDVTLAASVTISIVGFALGMGTQGKARQGYGLLVAVGAALGFLTKGPVAIALIVVTLAGFSLLRRDWRAIKSYPWVTGIFVFLVVVVPWFAWSEYRNPGFIKYFIWNENIGRYLFKDYGDLYGSGHRYVRGFVWVMLVLALLPWTPLLLQQAWKHRGSLRSEPRALLLAWGLSTAVFFTFIRQLHIGYILPSLPPLSLLLADFLCRDGTSAEGCSRSGHGFVRYVALLSAGVSLLALVWILFTLDASSAWHNIVPMAVLCGASAALLALWWVMRNPKAGRAAVLQGATVSLSLMYALLLIAITPQLDEGTSTASILRIMSTQIPEDSPEIGVVTRNTFSHYWLARAGDEELPRPVRVSYLDPSEVGTLRHILVKKKDFWKLPPGVAGTYHSRLKVGGWVWLEKQSG